MNTLKNILSSTQYSESDQKNLKEIFQKLPSEECCLSLIKSDETGELRFAIVIDNLFVDNESHLGKFWVNSFDRIEDATDFIKTNDFKVSLNLL